MMRKPIWLEVYCWACGEKEENVFSFDHTYPKNMGKSCCSYCGHILWIETVDILEVKDRRENREIPL